LVPIQSSASGQQNVHIVTATGRVVLVAVNDGLDGGQVGDAREGMAVDRHELITGVDVMGSVKEKRGRFS
jgi:hypothetical protein